MNKKTVRFKVGDLNIPDETLRHVEQSFNNFLLRYELSFEKFDPSRKWLEGSLSFGPEMAEIMDEEDMSHHKWVEGIIIGCLISEGVEVI